MPPPVPSLRRPSSARPSEWSTGLFGCARAQDPGLNCCVQNCCCQPCTWGDALRRAGVRDSGVYTLALVLGGRGCCDEFAGYVGRRRLAERYGIEESQAQACLTSACCAPCARWQELNTVLERERLRYACAATEPTQPPPPVPMTIVRSGGNGNRV